VFALKAPDPNLWLLDRFILLAAHEKLDIVICINKVDLVTKNEVDEIFNIYASAGYKIISTSSKTGEGMDQLRDALSGKISVFAGPSGVGKSTLLNNIQPNLELKTGDVSEKTSRGKHTTRHAELMELEAGGLVVDTPGFSSLDINFVNQADLEKYFNEIYELSHLCRFNGCKHYKEPSCAVKDAVEEGQISRWRYENYIRFLEEIKSIRRY